MNNDPDVWAAFESTPAPIEPIARRDNSLQGFQRRLLEECGGKLEEAQKDLVYCSELLRRARTMLATVCYPGGPDGYGDLLVDLDDMRDKIRGIA
jgi:hypothetical protein